MSGHSKWHNIQAHKGKQDKLKSNAFTKMARYITVAAREGGGDQNMNFGLRLAIEKAKEVNMPKDNIERAIKKGTGELNDGTTLDEVVYEGFGPGGVAVLVEAVTDNKNRTSSDLKHVFSLHEGNMAGPGSVQWQFAHCGVVRIEKLQVASGKLQGEDFELKMIEAGAEDIIENEFGVEIRTSVPNFQKVLDVVKGLGLNPVEAGLEWVAKEEIELGSEKATQARELCDALDEHDDVKAVYTNEK